MIENQWTFSRFSSPYRVLIFIILPLVRPQYVWRSTRSRLPFDNQVTKRLSMVSRFDIEYKVHGACLSINMAGTLRHSVDTSHLRREKRAETSNIRPDEDVRHSDSPRRLVATFSFAFLCPVHLSHSVLLHCHSTQSC